MKKILITGSAGLIGSSLSQMLQNDGYLIIASDLRLPKNELDFTDKSHQHYLTEVLSDCKGVIHLAGISRVLHGQLYPDLCNQVNVEGTANLLNACLSLADKPWFIYASSREVYGQQEKFPVTESAELKPMNTYALTKFRAEQLVAEASKAGLITSVLRFSNVFGGLSDHNDRVIPAFCLNCLRSLPIKLEGKDSTFDFTYLEDVVRGIDLVVKLLSEEQVSLPPIHFTSCQPNTLESLASIILDITGSNSDIKQQNPRDYDVSNFFGDFSFAKRLLGWEPQYSLRQGLSKFIHELKHSQLEQKIIMVLFMKILKVIHGYPPLYSAGSEVYSQLIAHELSNNHEIQVFTRQENSFLKDFHYKTALDYLDPRILLHIINIPLTKYRYRFINPEADERFEQLLNSFAPDIVHFGHLNHLSLSLPKIAHHKNIPTVFTLHDFWLMCPRGQFIQRNSGCPWELCDGQDNKKCAMQCYRGYFSGIEEDREQDIEYWESWIDKRMQETKDVINYIDQFIAPSKFLMNKFIENFNIPTNKITYLDYGFNLDRLRNRVRIKEDCFVFGYIGTHTPAKGIDLLLTAFSQLKGAAKLRIWGSSRDDTDGLKSLAAKFSSEVQNKIEWLGGYKNEEIVKNVFNRVDAIVVPSIWGENSPLVIHEAQQLRIPVITADYGGMSEYVKHQENGLLFKHRDSNDLKEKMQELAEDHELYKKISSKGYLYSTDGNVPSIQSHVNSLEEIYCNLVKQYNKKICTKPGPWRITFDTNPDHCNYACVMCECFSPYSKVKEERKEQGLSKRVMPIEVIRKVLAESVGSPLREIIPSTMGEPLLYKDFDQIISMCHEFGLKLNLTTNGSFPIRGAKEWAKSLVPILSDIKISWNGATKQTHEKIMIGSKWEHVNNNLRIFLAARDEYESQSNYRCSVTLQLTFLESNIEELGDVIKLAISLGIDRVKGHHLWAHFDEIKNLSMRRSKTSIEKWNHEVARAQQIREENLLPNGKKIILENIYPLSIDGTQDLAPGGPCPFLGKEAWINAEGRFDPCCAPDNLRKTLGSFGNVNASSIKEIWEGDNYRLLQKNYLNNELCRQCNMRKPLIDQ